MAERFDRGKITAFLTSSEGFMTLKGIATRTGVFGYLNEDGSYRYELRHPNEVINSDSLASLAGKPLTLEHPPDLLNPDTVGDYTVGAVGNKIEVIGDGLIEIQLNTHRRDAIDAIQNRSRIELSCGYKCEITPEQGEYNGEAYTHRQQNIRYNHVALVGRGRAGPKVRLRLDSNSDFEKAQQIQDAEPIIHKKDDMEKEANSKMSKLSIEGSDYDVDPAVASSYGDLQKQLEDIRRQLADLVEMEKEEDKGDSATKLRRRLQQVEGRADALQSEVNRLTAQISCRQDAPAIEIEFQHRWDTYEQAKQFLGSDFKFDIKHKPFEIKKLAIHKANPSMVLEGKDTAYIDAVFDTLTSLRSNGNTSGQSSPVDYLKVAIGSTESVQQDTNGNGWNFDSVYAEAAKGYEDAWKKRGK